ncbi:hypothetical protein [Actinotalea fermentans]|uniref:WXG100 family type VII secretion target n=1 Tax=Actinotalea fermentans TaxID=43671 RepID=A0A511Z106_9CELL|nr:hypothetical protein [Actinotalea fermentans]KGM15249.1 hypothetical protein N867_10505 [Actinotalea fermentans ATCC 43279 = JCM 9966 = DSM 3133]GEN81056.1 hypothetical protein AFE02nite_27900 [Actinotalea fermentans]
MTELAVRFETVLHARDVLDRQDGHACAIDSYLRAETDISDSTGLLLAALSPLSRAATELGAQAASITANAFRLAADQVTSAAADYVRVDLEEHEAMSTLGRRLGVATQPWRDPRASVPPLGGPVEQAPGDYGDVDSWLWDKASGTGAAVGDLITGGKDTIGRVSGWSGDATVVEAVDPRSYLVPPAATENWVQDVRWNAGVLLGSIDWVAEQFIGFSILERCVFSPLGGDWRAISRASEAWHHGASAAIGIGRNCAALSAGTVDGWQGAGGDAFRALVAAMSGGLVALAAGYDKVSGLVSTVATVSKLACAGIGMAIKQIANILIKIAAEAAVPVVGWAVGAATIWWDVEKVVGLVRLVYNLIETVMSAIEQFAESQVALLDSVRLLEDLVESVARRTGAVR